MSITSDSSVGTSQRRPSGLACTTNGITTGSVLACEWSPTVQPSAEQ
nr:hypothetical protein [Nocardia otitidiscaviarum]